MTAPSYNWNHRQFHVPQFFQFPGTVQVLIFLFAFFKIYYVVSRDSKVHRSEGLFFFFGFFFWFLLIITRSGRLAGIMRSVCISKSLWSLRVLFSSTDSGLSMYHLFVQSNLNFLHNSQWITLHTQLCLVLYSLCANLLHLLIMWLIILPLSPHNLHQLFCCILSILAYYYNDHY